jgi:uncharacterized protein YegL
MSKRPGGELATRPLHFIWICDCSGSMSVDGKIQALNYAIRDAVPHMRDVADENPNAQVLVRALRFSTGAQWHISQPTPIADFQWIDLDAPVGGVTDMGRALTLVAEELQRLPERGLPPVLVLLSDGQPSDDFSAGLRALMDQPWGKKAVRISIALGRDAEEEGSYEVLQRFIGHPELKPLQANNPEALVRQIKWVSTAVLKAASAPASQADTSAGGPAVNVPIPTAPDPGPASAADVW